MKVHEYFSILIFQGKCFCTIIFTTCQSAHFTWKGIFHLSISRYFLILAAYSKFKLFGNYADKNPVPVTIPTVNKINCLVIRRFKFSKILRKCLLKFHEKSAAPKRDGMRLSRLRSSQVTSRDLYFHCPQNKTTQIQFLLESSPVFREKCSIQLIP